MPRAEIDNVINMMIFTKIYIHIANAFTFAIELNVSVFNV